jgi:hypothetical protein
MIGVCIPKTAMTDEQYRSIDEEVTGETPPAGLKLHSCFREGDGLAVYDVWENQEAFEAFGAKLMPILQRMGIEMPQPQIVEMVAFEVP